MRRHLGVSFGLVPEQSKISVGRSNPEEEPTPTTTTKPASISPVVIATMLGTQVYASEVCVIDTPCQLSRYRMSVFNWGFTFDPTLQFR
jgi:hypothetical protein